MIVPNNKVLVEIEGFYVDKVSFLDTQLYCPQEGYLGAKRQYKGRVLCPISKISGEDKLLDNIDGHTYSDLHLEVFEGNTVYFYPRYCTEDIEVHDKDVRKLLSNAEHKVILLPYEAIFARERSGLFSVVNGYVLVEPIKETDKDIVTESGIWLKAFPENKLLQGRLKYFGQSLRCYEKFDKDEDGLEILEVGAMVYLSTNSDFEISIKGVNYYLCRKTDIVAVVLETPNLDLLIESEKVVMEKVIVPYADRIAFRVTDEAGMFPVGHHNRIIDDSKVLYSSKYDVLVHEANRRTSKIPIGEVFAVGVGVEEDIKKGDEVVVMYVEAEINGFCFVRSAFVEMVIERQLSNKDIAECIEHEVSTLGKKTIEIKL
jgi:co-chaperonin GroES (HSP10)